MKRIAAIIMHRAFGQSLGEKLVCDAREASISDLMTTLRKAGLDLIFLVTNDKQLKERLRASNVCLIASTSNSSFHFGKTLQGLVSKYLLDGIVYFGSGSGALVTNQKMQTLISFAKQNASAALFNNFYSCDFAAIAQARTLLRTNLPAIDNSLGFALSGLGFSCFSLPHDISTQFDIDTPTDLSILATTELGGKTLRALLEQQRPIHSTVSSLIDHLTNRASRLYLIGRVNPVTWSHFEQEIACRTSALAEGRGMRAYPSSKETFLAGALRLDKPHTFFSRLASIADAAIIDTRPLLCREGGLPSRADRFASDLYRPELIKDQLWATFTREAMTANIPIILGGHSLVSGGLYLLSKACWKNHDLPRRLHPETINWKRSNHEQQRSRLKNSQA